MPRIDKAYRRDKKRRQRNQGMQIDNRSIFIVAEQIVKSETPKVRRKKRRA